MTSIPRLDLEAAQAHLRALDTTTTQHIWLLTDDWGRGRPPRCLYGSIAELAAVMETAQREGFALHLTINAMHGRRRLVAAVERVRAVWAELDGPLIGRLPLDPSLLIRTSPGHGHIYWLVDPADAPSPEDAQRLCRTIARKHGGDVNACDLARVLRLAGSIHQKKTTEPHRVVIVGGTGKRYGRAEFLAAWPASPQPLPIIALPRIRHPDRYIDTALRGVLADLGQAVTGHRNAALNRAAFRIGQLGLAPEEAQDLLAPTALALGLAPREVLATIRSGVMAGSGAGGRRAAG